MEATVTDNVAESGALVHVSLEASVQLAHNFGP